MKQAAHFAYEQKLWGGGVEAVAGIDEVGRGAWAGPVVAGAVIFPKFYKPTFELFDSKLLFPNQREYLAKEIRQIAKVGIGVIGVPTINKVGIGKATQKAFKTAVKNLASFDCQDFLIDAFHIKHWILERQRAIKKGDRVCASIAAVSIVAKVYRDDLMRRLALKYPKYGFDIHKGYGTRLHQENIRKYAVSGVHRKSFKLKFLLT